jgi:rare lipoprotein A
MNRTTRWIPAAIVLAFFSGCTTPGIILTPDKPKGPIYESTPTFVQEGIASWYGGRWIGRLTANGERYRADDITAAHKKLPFHTMVRVTDLKTKNTIIVRINNRGPYVKGRIIDLSVVAAKKLGTYDRGLAKVRIEALKEIPVLKKSNLDAVKKPQPKPTPKASPSPTPKPSAKPQTKPSPVPGPTPKSRRR